PRALARFVPPSSLLPAVRHRRKDECGMMTFGGVIKSFVEITLPAGGVIKPGGRRTAAKRSLAPRRRDNH
ncbi:MAG: hypothetical protein ACR2LZ_10785, partial [Pyrinomonadaceae bacterium]